MWFLNITAGFSIIGSLVVVLVAVLSGNMDPDRVLYGVLMAFVSFCIWAIVLVEEHSKKERADESV